MTAPVQSNIANPGNFLATSRNFPSDAQALSVELSKSYIDIATQVNNRTSGLFATSSTITGESWYLAGQTGKQNTIRQAYLFTTTASINHGIQNVVPNQFTNCFGSYTDGMNSYGLIWGTSVAITGQILFYITSTQIVFVTGAGAPALTAGRIVLQWLSNS